MKRLEPVDISIISAYMGRFQTAIVALLVFAITVHAFITQGSTRSHSTLTIAVPGGELGRACDPVTRIVERATERPTQTVVAEDGWTTTSELYLMPAADYVRERKRLGLEPLFAMGRAGGDRAVVVSRPGAPWPPHSARDVLVADTRSLNECWVQMRALAGRGLHIPRADSLRVAPGRRAERVVCAVSAGEADFGACRASDVDGDTTLAVSLAVVAVPEVIVAARRSDADYLRSRLTPVVEMIDERRPGQADRDAVELAADRGLATFRPVTPVQMDELRAVFEFMKARM